MWTLANSQRVPEPIRRHFASFGLCKDEFVATGGWPPQIYVREGRRMRGAYVMTEHEVRGRRKVEDPVGLAAYGMDSHNVRRYVDARGFARNEGDVQVHGFVPYGISYRSLVPRPGQCKNLLVPVALSATHIAFGSIRMEPVFMVLAQSAADAADMALEHRLPVQDVPYSLLRERLLGGRQVIRWSRPADSMPPGLGLGVEADGLEGVVVDDDSAHRTGSWVESRSVGPFVGAGYRHDGASGKGRKSVTFALTVPEAGTYALQVGYTAHANRAARVPVAVRVGRTRLLPTVRLDQRRPPSVDRLFEPVGPGIRLRAREEVRVEISNRGTVGYVVVDAVRLVRQPADPDSEGRRRP